MSGAPQRTDGLVAQVEDQILGLLRRGLGTSWRIEPFPADPQAFDLAGAERTVLVHYTGSRTERAEGLGGGQVRRPAFAVHLYLRDLRGDGGSYRAIEDVRLGPIDIQDFQRGRALIQFVPGQVIRSAGNGEAI